MNNKYYIFLLLIKCIIFISYENSNAYDCHVSVTETPIEYFGNSTIQVVITMPDIDTLNTSHGGGLGSVAWPTSTVKLYRANNGQPWQLFHSIGVGTQYGVAGFDAMLAAYPLVPGTNAGPDHSCDVCDDKYKAALAQCGGDVEKVQQIGECEFFCSPCIVSGGDSWGEAITKCGGANKLKSYNPETCESECQADCADQYSQLAVSCGGSQYIDSYDYDKCSGTCQKCGSQHPAAKAECGNAGYTMDPLTCEYECNGCKEQIAACDQYCSGNTAKNTCLEITAADGTKSLEKVCWCLGQQPPEGAESDSSDPGSSDGKTTTINDDGTKTTVEQHTETGSDGIKTTTTKTTKFDKDGNIISEETTTKSSQGVNVEGQGEEGEGSDEESEPYTATKGPLSAGGTISDLNGMGAKQIGSMGGKMIDALNRFSGVGRAPIFDLQIYDWHIMADLSVFDPVAVLVRSLFKILFFVGSIWLTYDLWKRWG